MTGTFGYKEMAAHLKSWVADVLSQEIGSYHWANQIVTPAVTIVGNQQTQHPPAGVRVEGLECVIFYPEPNNRTLMGNHLTLDNWVVLLKQWDNNKSTLPIKDTLIRTSLYPVTGQLKIEGNAVLAIPEMFRIVITIPNYLTTR